MARTPTLGVTIGNGGFTDDLTTFTPARLPALRPAQAVTPRLTLTQQRQVEERTQEAATKLEIEDTINRYKASPAWDGRSIQSRREALKTWTEGTLTPYLDQRFATDTLSANAFRNAVTQVLNAELDTAEANTNTYVNQGYNLLQSVGSGLDQAYDALVGAVPAIYDRITTGENPYEDFANAVRYRDLVNAQQAELTPEEYQYRLTFAEQQLSEAENALSQQALDRPEWLSNLINEQKLTAKNEAQRRANNPLRDEIYRRNQEILADNPDAIPELVRAWEDRSLFPVANLVAEQAGNVAAIVGSSIAGRAIGGVAGAPLGPGGIVAGQAVGGVAGASAASSLLTAGSAVSQLAQEIYEAPVSKLQGLQLYRQLSSEGLTEPQIRDYIAQVAIDEAYPLALGLGAVAGVLGPEALLARSSVLQPLLQGGIGRRFATGAGLSAVTEGITEGAEQVIQNQAWNVGTLDNRSLGEGVIRAAGTGALVGGVIGGGAGALSPTQTVVEPPQANTPATTSGGFNIPEQVSSQPLPTTEVINPVYNEAEVARQEQLTSALNRGNAILESLSVNNFPSPEKLNSLYAAYASAIDNGADVSLVSERLFEDSLAATENTPDLDLLAGFQEFLRNRRPVDLTESLTVRSLKEEQDSRSLLTGSETFTQIEDAAALPVSETTPTIDPSITDPSVSREDALRQLLYTIAVQNGSFNPEVLPTRGLDLNGPSPVQPAISSGTSGADSASSLLDSAAADAGASSVSAVLAPSNPVTLGDGAATESAGIGGAARPNAGTFVAPLRADQPVGGPTLYGADSGRSGAVTDTTGAQSDLGQRGIIGATELEPASAIGRAAAARIPPQSFNNIGSRPLFNTQTGIETAREAYARLASGELVTSVNVPFKNRYLVNPDYYVQVGYDTYTAVTAANEAYARLEAEAFADIRLNQLPQDLVVAQTIDESLSESIESAVAIAENVMTQDPSITAQAMYAGAQENSELGNPLITLGNASDVDIQSIMTAQFTPAIRYELNSIHNGVLFDKPYADVKGGEQANTLALEPTLDEQIAENEALALQLQEVMEAYGPIPLETREVEVSEGIYDMVAGPELTSEQQEQIQSISDYIAERAERASGATERGAQRHAANVKKFSDVQYSPRWTAGFFAKLSQANRKNWVDSAAAFDTWVMEHFPSADVTPEQTPLIQARRRLHQSTSGAAHIVEQQCLIPLSEWAEARASELGTNTHQFIVDVGNYQSVLHTLEAAPYQRLELGRALQDAYLITDAFERGRAVIAAERNMSAYMDRQNGIPSADPYPIYGGRTVGEALEIKNQLESQYDIGDLEAGSQLLRDGFDFVLRFALENGVIDQQTFNSYPQWAYFSSLTVDQESGTGAVNDFSYYTPRLNFHRRGSVSPAQDAFTALIGFANRTIRTVGMSEFNTQLNQTYLVLEQRNNVTRRWHDIPFYDGMARVDESYLNAVLYGGEEVNPAEYRRAQELRDESDLVIRDMVFNEDGEQVIKSYRIIIDKETHPEVKRALRAPFEASQMGLLGRGLARTTNTFGRMYTSFRPMFPVVNAGRDAVERLTYLTADNFRAEDGSTVSGLAVAARMSVWMANPVNWGNAIKYALTGSSFSANTDAHLADFYNSGTHLSSNFNRMLQNFRKTSVDDITAVTPNVFNGVPTRTANQVMSVLNSWSEAWYAYPTFAQYVTMRNMGLSVTDASNATVSYMNMQQRGVITGQYLSPLFPFTNSIGQTAANFLRYLGFHTTAFSPSHPRFRQNLESAGKAWATMFLSYMALRMLAPMVAEGLNKDGDDGQERLDQIPLTELGTMIPVGLGDGSYFRLPTGFGPMAFISALAFGADRVERNKMTAGDLGATLMVSFGKALVPNSAPAFNFSEAPVAFIAQTFSPMLLQPVTQLATNRNYAGGPITREPADGTRRKSDTYNLTTSRAWSDGWFGTKNIYRWTNVDIAPEELKTAATGWAAGPLTMIISWIEGDPLYSNPNYQSTREQLGPFWTAMGATTIYNTGMNLTNSSFYTALNRYEGRIKKAGIAAAMSTDNAQPGEELSGSATERTDQHRRNVMLAAGFTVQEADDYVRLRRAATDLQQVNTQQRRTLDAMFGPDMDEVAIRAAYTDWSNQRHNIQQETVDSLNFYRSDYSARFGVPDQESADQVRNLNSAPVAQRATIDLNTYTRSRTGDGTPSTVPTVSFQDEMGLKVLLPLMRQNGQVIDRETAIREYYTTGLHLGKFRTNNALNEAIQNINAGRQ